MTHDIVLHQTGSIETLDRHDDQEIREFGLTLKRRVGPNDNLVIPRHVTDPRLGFRGSNIEKVVRPPLVRGWVAPKKMFSNFRLI